MKSKPVVSLAVMIPNTETSSVLNWSMTAKGMPNASGFWSQYPIAKAQEQRSSDRVLVIGNHTETEIGIQINSALCIACQVNIINGYAG